MEEQKAGRAPHRPFRPQAGRSYAPVQGGGGAQCRIPPQFLHLPGANEFSHKEFRMTAYDLTHFGANYEERMSKALEAFRRGEGLCVVDDEDRENEGDLIFSAQHLTEAQVAQMIRDCSGIVCVCLTEEACERLALPPMVQENTNTQGTAFTVSIEAAEGVTTGVSAHDRLVTIQAAANPSGRPEDLRRPGHVYPLKAKNGGVLERRGHTESSIDLCRLAGLAPAGVLCELMHPDGTMMRLPDVARYAVEHGMAMISVEDIAQYRMARGC